MLSQDWRIRQDAEEQPRPGRGELSPRSKRNTTGSRSWRTANPPSTARDRSEDRASDVLSRHGGRPSRAEASSNWRERPVSILSHGRVGDGDLQGAPDHLSLTNSATKSHSEHSDAASNPEHESAPGSLISRLGRPLESIAGMSTRFPFKSVSASKDASWTKR